MNTQDEIIINGGVRQYWTVLTNQGAAAIADQLLAGTKLDITYIAAGDGGGAYYEPSADQTALVREMWRDEIADYSTNPLDPRMLDIKGIIPSDVGGFTIRELGVFDRSGTLIGVCNTPDMEKAPLLSGAGGKMDLIMHLIVMDANAVNVVVKPSLNTVSLEDVNQLLEGKQEKLTGVPGQIPVFDENGELKAQDFSSAGGVSGADKGAPGGVASLDENGKIPEAQLPWRWHVVAARPRTPGKPTYGLGGGGDDGGGISVALETGPYTGTTEAGVVVSGVLYDAKNMGTNGDTVPEGTILIKTEEQRNG